MRIIAGKCKGKILRTVDSDAIRPTLARIRKSCFDILVDSIKDSRCIDLFAGAGTLGIEALSRGAKEVVFVDNSKQSINTIRKNLINCKLENSAKTILGKIPEIIKTLSGVFSIVFIDAPYDKNLNEPAIIALSETQKLEQKAIVVVQVSKREELLDHYGKIVLKSIREYGDTKLYFYENT